MRPDLRRRSLVVKHFFGKEESAGSIPADGSSFEKASVQTGGFSVFRRVTTRMRFRPAFWLAVFAVSLAACSGKGGIPPLGDRQNLSSTTLIDAASQPCTISYDGLIWYSIPSGSFAPVQQQHSTCARSTLSLNATPPIPSWAKPSGPTQTIFVATSLQENYTAGGMQALENAAAPHHVPVSWMMANSAQYLAGTQASLYDAYHVGNGDDVEGEIAQVPALEATFPWYVPSVDAEVGGRGHPNRNPAAALAIPEHAFWGITWNSLGTDDIQDYGAPWGTYCADPSSYKRPAADGSCTLLAFEWTARDLTRAYFSGQEAAFSTDPDDLLQRGGFTTQTAQTYVAQIVDAYAAAGQTQPLVMVSQQESAEALDAGTAPIMDALYGRAVTDGMKLETLAQASNDARAFSANPRAIAFPFINGGKNAASALLGGTTVYPATIDYHDRIAGMTFAAGQTLPARVFRYADYGTPLDALPLPQVPAAQLPSLTNVAVNGGKIVFHFDAPAAMHYGVAIWSDPSTLGLSGSNVVPAGHAGAVLVFDLQSGPNDVSFACASCGGTTFPYSL